MTRRLLFEEGEGEVPTPAARPLAPDALKDLTPEWQKVAATAREHAAKLPDAELALKAEQCMRNSVPIRWAPGVPVYDATLWHVLVPELINRMKGKSLDRLDLLDMGVDA